MQVKERFLLDVYQSLFMAIIDGNSIEVLEHW